MMNAIEVFIGGLGRVVHKKSARRLKYLKARSRLRLYFFVAIRPFLKRARPSDRGIYIFSFNFLLYNFNFYCPHFSSIIFITLFNKLIYIHYLKITFFNSLNIHCRNFIKEWKEQDLGMYNAYQDGETIKEKSKIEIEAFLFSAIALFLSSSLVTFIFPFIFSVTKA